jgi:cell division protein FtsQ
MARGMAARRVNLRIWRRRAILAAVVALIVVAGYMIWLRNSSWFAIEEVEVEGLTANQQDIAASLQGAAKDMTTLHIRDDELRDAVSGYPTVASIKADATLLHKLRIEVTERLPVAVAKVNGQSVAISAEGYVLLGVEFDPKELPSLDAGETQGALLDEEGSAQAAILGAVPEDLRSRLKSATWDEERGGVVADLDGAPELRFGDGEDAEDKWKAVAAVLTDPDLGSPFYVDVSVPGRPVAG